MGGTNLRGNPKLFPPAAACIWKVKVQTNEKGGIPMTTITKLTQKGGDPNGRFYDPAEAASDLVLLDLETG